MTTPFDQKAPGLVRRLMADFGLTDIQAAAIVGNLGHESGLVAINEKNPTVPGSRGGYGWAQWTGPRRVAFERYVARTHQDPTSDGAQYGYLWRELSGHEPGFDYRHAIEKLKETTTLEAATDTFQAHYEKAGIKHTASRRAWAQKALSAFRGQPAANAEVKRIQERLTALGHPVVADGVIGPQTLGAIAAALGV